MRKSAQQKHSIMPTQNSNIQISANDILTKYEEANDNLPLSRQQIIDAMNNYADICITKTHDLLTSADYLLAPVEDLYRDEHPSPCFYIPCRHKLFKWIAEKLSKRQELKSMLRIAFLWGRDYGEGRSDKNFNDLLNTSTIKQAIDEM